MVLIRPALHVSLTRCAAKFIALALLGFGTVSCGSDTGQHVYTQTLVAPTSAEAASDTTRGKAAPITASDQQDAKPAAVVANVGVDTPAPVPAYGSSSYHPAPYFYGPVGAILPTAH